MNTQHKKRIVEKEEMKHVDEQKQIEVLNQLQQIQNTPTPNKMMSLLQRNLHNTYRASHAKPICKFVSGKEAAHGAKTSKISQFFGNRYKLAFGITLVCHLLIILTTGVLMTTDQDPFPIFFKSKPLYIRDNIWYLRTLAWKEKFNSIPRRKIVKEMEKREVAVEATYDRVQIEFFYEADNLLTKERLTTIAALEKKFINLNCQFTPDSCTIKGKSLIQVFIGPKGYSFENIPQTLQRLNATKPELVYELLGRGSSINETHAISPLIKTLFSFGIPKSMPHTNVYTEKHYLKRLREIAKEGLANGIAFLYYYDMEYEVERQVEYDLYLAGGSFTFIVVFMLFQTQSLFITGFAIFSILSCFLGANLIYRYIFDCKYFGVFQALSVFIILGIGADDIFVYYDTWRGSASQNFRTMEERVTACYFPAVKAMFVTSFTTMVAFLTNCNSPLLMVWSFGLFSALLILVNYISVITFFPAVVVLYTNHIESCQWPCFNFGFPNTVENKTKLKKNIIVTFFRNVFFKWVTHPIAKWVILIDFTALLAVFVYMAFQIEPQKEEIKWLVSSHNYAKVIKRKTSFSSDETPDIYVYITWGLKPQEITHCHKTDFKCVGNTTWDQCFDLNPVTAQIAFLKLCHKLRNMTSSEKKWLRVKTDKLTGENQVTCFLKDFDQTLRLVSRGRLYYNYSLPWTVKDMEAYHLYEKDGDPYNNFYRPFDNCLPLPEMYPYPRMGRPSPSSSDMTESKLMLKYAVMNQYHYHTATRAYYSEDFLLTLENNTFGLYDPGNISDVNNTAYEYYRLRYAAIIIATSVKQYSITYKSGLDLRDAWENFTQTEMKNMPPSLSGGFQSTPQEDDTWHWFSVQKMLVESAYQGIGISIFLALMILTLFSRNFILGFLATATICCVTISVIGVIPLAGWHLGVLESLNLTLVVGMAVDYVVHLAVGYHHSPHKHRLGRLRDTLEHVGLSVLSGAVTTMGASLFLLFAQILFFYQFGIFMFCTIGFSLLYSTVLFSVLLGIIGPEHEAGSLAPYFIWFKELFVKK